MPIMGNGFEESLEAWRGKNAQGEEILIKENILVKLEIIPKSSLGVVNFKD